MSATRIEVDHVKFKTLFAGTFHEESQIGLLKSLEAKKPSREHQQALPVISVERQR